ncbi:unnamed protein product [Allacma fusca]|uniref:Uncharacterized protein n=1 Tax=Allacma fusca TaxID=39272 RepID=A0A8J2K3M7_9HEXA|nr:unnamed protein product [Allacma fusca]
MRIQRKKIYLTIVVLYSLVIVVHGQSEWVWGKNPNGNNNNNRPPSGGSSSGVVSNNGPAGSNLVPVNTVTIFGNGAGIVSGPSGSSSASGDQYFASQTGSGSQPAVIVQVLQPGGSGSGFQAGGTGSSIPASPDSGSNFPSSSSSNNNFLSSSSPNSNFPASPVSGSGLQSNDAIPSNSIRSVPPVQGEPRLFTKHLRNLFANAINNLVGGSGSSHSSSSHSQSNNGGLFPSGSSSGTSNQGLINSLLQLSQGLGNRFPTASPLPVSSSGGGSSFLPSSSGGSGGGNCKCVPDDQCRLPFIATGTCSIGTMCCRRSGTRTVGEYTDRDRDNTRTSSVRFQPAALRAGLFREIVQGTSNVIDDTLDLILAPYLTEEDRQKLATRLGSNRKS